MKGKTVLLGVCGGIAAYKAAFLCSRLAQAGAEVHVIMTESATKLVAPLTFQALAKTVVMTDTFDEKRAEIISHIDLADRADLVIIAPATANIIGKMAHGIADDMLSTTLLAVTAPILLAPAMNVHMYDHPAVQENLRILGSRGVHFVEPGVGQLACGYVGKGRLAEPEAIQAAAARLLDENRENQGIPAANLPKPEQILAGRKLLVTAGGTQERLDPVRFFSNDSSGKMGFAIAEAAQELGADVTVVYGKTSVSCPDGVEKVPVESAAEMMDAVLDRLESSDIIIKAAAVADYRPAEPSKQKIKKTGDTLTVTLIKNPDILETVGKRKTKQFLVGFAAETERMEEYAMDKLRRKNCDLMVGNDVSQDGAGFGTDTNIVSIFDKDGLVEAIPMVSKKEAADRLLHLVASRLPAPAESR